MKITTHLYHISDCETASGTNCSNAWTGPFEYVSKNLAGIESDLLLSSAALGNLRGQDLMVHLLEFLLREKNCFVTREKMRGLDQSYVNRKNNKCGRVWRECQLYFLQHRANLAPKWTQE